jgi:uncharacterized protein (DUF2461 family)
MKIIKQSAFNFLDEIAINNNREWFLENKERYLWIKKELETFSAHWFGELNKFDESLRAYDEKPYIYIVFIVMQDLQKGGHTKKIMEYL